jgi:hypothetical protein
MLRINGEDLKLDEAMIKMQSMDEESRNKFLADSKPKTMEEMAKEQLTVGKQQLAAIKSLANVRGAAYASTSTQEMAFGASMEVTNAITKLMGSDNLSVKGLRQSQEKMTTEMISQIQSGDLTGAVDTFTKESKSYLDKSFDDFIKNGTEAMNDIKNSSNPLIGIFTSLATEVGKVVTNYEKLNTSAGTTTTTPEKNKVIVTATPTTTTPENKEIKTTSEEKTNKESTTSEIKFNPLEIKLTISGLLPGMSEEQIKQLIIDGKLNEALYDAVKNAEKTKVTK